MELVAQHFSGPIPHPIVLEHYEAISPGAADRIIALAESETKHRHSMEIKMLEADIQTSQNSLNHIAREVKTGQILGFFIGIFAISAGVYITINGHPVSGALFGTGGVLGLVTAFIYGRSGQNNNVDQPKREERNHK